MFLLILSSPSTPSFLHNTYSRSTLSMLRVQTVVAPSGLAIIEEIISQVLSNTPSSSWCRYTDYLLQTFYSVDFEPDVMIGPAALEYLVDFCARHTASVDSMLTIIQVSFLLLFQCSLQSSRNISLHTWSTSKIHLPISREMHYWGPSPWVNPRRSLDNLRPSISLTLSWPAFGRITPHLKGPYQMLWSIRVPSQSLLS